MACFGMLLATVFLAGVGTVRLRAVGRCVRGVELLTHVLRCGALVCVFEVWTLIGVLKVWSS